MSMDSVDVPAAEEASFANRRSDERVSAKFEVRFAHAKEAARALRAYSLNLSAGGLCIRTQRSYDVGSPVRVEMHVGGETFQLSGIIAWVRDESEAIGVRFTDMSEQDRTRLQRVVESFKR